MRPIRTDQSNFTYLGPTPEIGDLPCERRDGAVYSVYELTDEERTMIANGAQIRLGIHHEPIPPVSLGLCRQDEVDGLAELGGVDHRCARCRGLYVEARAVALGKTCGFCQGQQAISAGTERPPGPPDPPVSANDRPVA